MRHFRGLILFCFLTPALAQVKTDGPTDEKAQKTFEKAQKYLHERHKEAALDEFKKADKQDGGLPETDDQVRRGTRRVENC
jgi:hypothetical protein